MADNFFKVKKGLNVEPQASPTLNQDGDIAVDSSTNKLNVRLNGATDDVVLEDAAQTLTNKTLTTPVISSISNTGTLTLPTSTDTLVGRDTTDTLTNKTLTAPNIDAVTFDGQASAPSNPSAGNYKVYVDDTTSKLQILDSSGTVTTVGTSAGGINYITNGDAEAATTGWATYADAAGTSPVDGTGGSANVTFTRSTTNPLRGLGSFLITKDAANRQGEGASYAFTIADADKAKMMQIDFELEVNSGTYVTGDVAVYIVDVTNGTVIQPSGYQVENVGIESRQRLTFQTASNSTSYRLCFHVASTSALAYALKIDTITLGPQIVPLGAPVTDWVSYTPTGSWVSNTTYTGRWRRVGDSAEVQIKIATTGAPTSANLTVNLPSGLVMDTTKLLVNSLDEKLPGSAGNIFDNGTTFFDVDAYYFSTTAVLVKAADASSTYVRTISTVTQAVPMTWASGDNLSLSFRVPIVGWSSSTVVSSSADTRVVAARAYRATDQTGVNPNNSFVKLTYNTADFDTAGCFDTSNNRFTVKVPGKYRIAATAYFAGTNTLNNSYGLAIYKNGSVASYGEFSTNATATAAFSRSATTDLNLVANDYIEIYLYGQGNNSVSTMTMTGGTAVSSFSVDLIQGPSQIAASEVIAFRAYRNTDQTGINPNGTAVKINFDTVTSDTHGGFSTANFRYTAPAPGYYTFQTQIFIGSTNVLNANRYEARFYVNGSVVEILNTEVTASATIQLQRGGCSTPLRLNAGDYVEVYFFGSGNNSVSTLSALGGSTITYFGGYRLGGVM